MRIWGGIGACSACMSALVWNGVTKRAIVVYIRCATKSPFGQLTMMESYLITWAY